MLPRAVFFVSLCALINCQFAVERPFKISLAISAKLNALEIAWYNLDTPNTGHILLTNEEPQPPYQEHHLPATDSSPSLSSGSGSNEDVLNRKYNRNANTAYWTFGKNRTKALYWLRPNETNGWLTTNVIFDNSLLATLKPDTKCYGYWAVYVDDYSNAMFSTCMRAHATWMNDHKEMIKRFRFRDLFIMGTHDSGSYRLNFNSTKNETLVTKYSLTQSDDITSQLMHGVRYLDIRVGYYRSSDPQFWVNHGISRQQPLAKVLRQVKDFVLATNEIVIFDIQEFPVGFGKSLDIHRKLVRYVQNEIGDLMVDPSHGWDIRFDQIWQSHTNIIVSYDHLQVVNEFPALLFLAVQQRWGNCQSLSDLKRYLTPAGFSFPLSGRFTPRPFADMAELTPTTWDLLTDKWGGLRVIADQSNRHISKWYADDWFMSANIVAVDFYRGTNLIETAMYANMKKELLRRMRRNEPNMNQTIN